MLCGVGFFFFQAEDGIRDIGVTGVQTCALPILEDREEGRRRGEGRGRAGDPREHEDGDAGRGAGGRQGGGDPVQGDAAGERGGRAGGAEVARCRTRADGGSSRVQTRANSSGNRILSACAILYNDVTLALLSARSICDRSDTDSPVRFASCFSVRERFFRRSRMQVPMFRCSSSSGSSVSPFAASARFTAPTSSSSRTGLRK